MPHIPAALLACAVAIGALATPAFGGPQPESVHYDGVATITANNELLGHDGTSEYSHPRGNVFVNDDLDDSTEDMFALYVGARHNFTLTFNENSYTCAGASHVFFEGQGWWEETSEPGKQALGSTGIWCDQGNNTAYAVRYPGYHRYPATADSSDCVVATRLGDHQDGGRQYRIATPEPADPPAGAGPLDGLFPQDPPAAEANCPAKVFYVTSTGASARDSRLDWEGEAAFEILTTLEPAKSTGPRK